MSDPIKQGSSLSESIDSLSADDFAPAQKKKKSLPAFLLDNLRSVILIVCVFVLLWSGKYIITSIIHYIRGDAIYGDLSEQIMGEDKTGITPALSFRSRSAVTPDYAACQKLTGEEIENIGKKETSDPAFEKVRNKLIGLKAQYPDLYGWIEIPGTGISYPIMQSNDNDYYLDHSYKGTALKSGSIFADYRNGAAVEKNRNFILYGHHMTSNAMFHALDNYLSEKYFRENNKIIIYTLEGMFTYRIFAVYNTDMYYPYITTYFASDEDFVAFCDRAADNSVHAGQAPTFDGGSRIITLSTCSNRTEDGRLAVHGVLESIVR